MATSSSSSSSSEEKRHRHHPHHHDPSSGGSGFTWTSSASSSSSSASRLIPRIVHQTWYERVTRKKYPNMSRLIESWKTSGWQYEFYDDDRIERFLGEHFPPQVLEAYHAITPGAFKADLFRYCVLLIKGGIYADMDVLLESNLDRLLDPRLHVGFLVPMDEPGAKVGHRSCLWNGLLAVAPGHPFLAQTIELVVNNIRNRFTSVDYDDMLCPDPILSVSHSVDTLFTCGPCILGAAMNRVLGRHMQHGWSSGDVDLWEAERTEQERRRQQKQQQQRRRRRRQRQQEPEQEDHPFDAGRPNPLPGLGEGGGGGDDQKGSRHEEGGHADRVPVGGGEFWVDADDPRLRIPGRTVILGQNKNDMGSHRFTWVERNLMVAATDMPNYDDRPPDKEHYSKTHEKKAGVYGLKKLHVDTHVGRKFNQS